MPDKTIYPDIFSADEIIISEVRNGTNYTREYEYANSDETFIGLHKDLFVNINTSIDNILPENSKFLGITIKIYVRTGRIGEKVKFILGDVEKSNILKEGYNSFYFSDLDVSDYLRDSSQLVLKVKPKFTFADDAKQTRVGYTIYSDFDVSKIIKVANQNAASTQKPIVIINYEYNSPVEPSNLVPENTTLNPRTDILFTWNSRINQESFRLQYRHESTSAWTTVTRSTSERSYLLPADSITQTEGKIFWRVQVAEANGVYSKYVSSSFTLGTLSQQVPQVIYPVSDYIESGKPITFEWRFVPNTTEKQVESEISINKGDGYVTKNYPSSKQKITEDLEINNSRIIYWKLRVKNQFGEWSPWTEEISFQIIGKPPQPQITSVENNNRPLIKWTSSDQETYRIEILDINNDVIYDSGNRIGRAAREYKIKQPLENGKYFIRLTVANVYGVNSPTVEYTHVIDPEPVSQPNIELYSDDFSITLKSNKDGDVLRDGKYIGNTVNGVFRDFTGANKRKYKYVIRSYENDILADSETKGGSVDFGIRNTLATVEDPSDYLVLEFQIDESPNKKATFSIQGEAIDLEGLEYPIYEFGEKKNEVFNFEFMFEKYDEVKKFRELISEKSELILRDNRGRIYQGCITILDYEDNNFGYSISSTLIRTGDFYE